MLREITVKIRLERINIQKEITVEALLDSGIIGLVMSSEFTRKQGFKVKKIERPIYVRNLSDLFNKEEPIKHIVEVNIYYQEHRERMKINMIEGQKQSIILGMPWFVYYNPKINWKTEEVKITRYPEECSKQQRPKQEKLEQQKQKEEEKKKEEGDI